MLIKSKEGARDLREVANMITIIRQRDEIGPNGQTSTPNPRTNKQTKNQIRLHKYFGPLCGW